MVSGILADRLGIRTVGLIGGLLALVGTLCSAFVQNILLLYLTYGVIMGTGFAFAYPPSLAILGHYFKRKIGLANGLVTFGDLHSVSRVRIQQAAFLVMGVTTTCAPLAGSFTSLLVVAVVLGMCDGTVFCMFGPVAFDLVGPVDSAQALGFVFGLLALPASLGPPLAGLLYDHFGNYNLAFHVAGVPLLAGAALMCFIPFR
nr:hypothetical protein BaRGS_020545 [Batillaria attramentaria]